MLIGRSLAVAVVGALPVPVLDDWLVATIRKGTVKRIAEAHGVDMDDEAVHVIAQGTSRPPTWADLVTGGFTLRLMTRQWKKLVIAVLAAKRAQTAARDFEVTTLFDHYCARRHVGLGLNAQTGAAIRRLIEEARATTTGGLSRSVFRRGVLAAARASVRAPVEMLDALTGGRLKKLLTSDNEVAATTEVDEALEAYLNDERNFLGRAVAAIELQLAADNNPYLDHLIATFDGLLSKERDKKEGEL